jgi:atlastin
VNETGDAFQLHEAKLNFVLKNVPKDVPVSILSVVGAFRTGKSFLLDLFLRYLRYYDENPDAIASPESRDWLGPSDAPLEGQANTGSAPEFSAIKSKGEKKKNGGGSSSSAAAGSGSSSSAERAGFKWRSGRERTTTGIWLWSRPFVRTLPSGEKVAVLIMDTQGLFDTDTAQMLTTSIFGLSTLISSYVCYNLPNRIQEDYLQNLALFSEYGRRVLEVQKQAQEEAKAEGATEEEAILGGAESASSSHGDDDENYEEGEGAGVGSSSLAARSSSSSAISSPASRLASMKKRRMAAGAGSGSNAIATPPFQRIDLLVRDADIESDVHDWTSLKQEMGAYLNAVLSKTHHEDLRTVREHIASSFETVSCFLLPHPGLHVRKADFDGSVRGLEPDFITVLCYFMHCVFHENLVPKKVHGRVVNARQLGRYVEAYARLFQDVSYHSVALEPMLQ